MYDQCLKNNYETMIITVLSGKCDSILINASYICTAVPSKNLPHPPKNNVSPVKKMLHLYTYCI